MLKRLYISNFTLIEEMDVSFPGGLTVITGETGAGKSIFLEALGLALGNRADMGVLKNKDKKCIVEVELDLKGQNLESFFLEQELEYDDTVILRREIGAEGKSRSLINDSLVKLSVLKKFSSYIIDIHSQHQTFLLNESEFQFELLDAFANSGETHALFKKEYGELQLVQNKLQYLVNQEAAANKELDYYQFLFDEFEKIEIKSGQLEQLEQESLTIENAEQIKTNLAAAVNILSGGDTNTLSALSQLKQLLNTITKFSSNYQDLSDRLNAVQIELKDLVSEFENAESSIFFNENRLEEINNQIDALNRLLKKHQVKTESELLEVKHNIELKLNNFNSIEQELEKIKIEQEKKKNACLNLAAKLSKMRKDSLLGIEEKVKAMLINLSMPNAVFKIELTNTKDLTANGTNTIRFLFSANKGVAANELSKVASGGELSRLMLTLKYLLATKKKLPSIIFDEIDTGVSGEVANKIGNVLFQMGNNMQVIAITHLPQMASKGNHHLFVYKNQEENNTNSFIKEIKGEDRIKEIAKMLSAGSPTQSAIVNATELLSMN